MNPKLNYQKGVSASGVRLFERALSVGYVPSPTSPGPANFLRRRKEAKRAKQLQQAT